MASELVCNCFRELTYEAVCDWVGQRTGERARGCCPNVGEMVALPDGYAACVMGRELYVTNVYVDETGKPASVCSCPVGVNCMHGAALALEVSRKLNAGLEIDSATDRCLMLDREDVFERNRRRNSKGSKGRQEERFDPFYLNAYDEPKELADAIVLRLDTGDGLRFRTEWNDLLVDVVDSTGTVKKTSWESVKAAFYNRADVNIDEVTGVESRSGLLYFGAKGARFAEHDRISFCPLRTGNVRSRRGCACIRRDHAAFFALADYVLRPTLKPGDRELSCREWESYLARVRLLMTDARFRVRGNRTTVLAHAFRDSHDVGLLDDLERWSRKILRQEDRIRIEGINDVW